MGFLNPFPWVKPVVDRRAIRPEPLRAAGLGTGRPPRESKTALDRSGRALEILALVLGIGLPMATVLIVSASFPPVVWAGAALVVVAAVVVNAMRRRAQRRRAWDRAVAREARRSPNAPRVEAEAPPTSGTAS